GTLAGQTSADQAATLRAQEIANAQSGLAGVTGAGANQGITQGNDIAGLENNQWQFQNTLGAQQQQNLNNVIANSVSGANTFQQGLLGSGIGSGAGLGAGLAAAAAHGKVVDKPTVLLAGEAGKEAIVPIHDDG